MIDADTRGLLVLFEPELTLALLTTWWIEVPTISTMERTYHGVTVDDLIFFDWRVARDGSVMGITFLPPERLPQTGDQGLQASLESLTYVDDPSVMPTVWLSEKLEEDEDPNARILQDFAASLYVTESSSWGLAVNIDWLSVQQRNRLIDLPAKWVDADCELVEPGQGVSLCKAISAPGLFQLRGWFGASEGH